MAPLVDLQAASLKCIKFNSIQLSFINFNISQAVLFINQPSTVTFSCQAYTESTLDQAESISSQGCPSSTS